MLIIIKINNFSLLKIKINRAINKYANLFEINIKIIKLMIFYLKNNLIFPFLILILFNTKTTEKYTDVTPGVAVIPNECSTLGANNPLIKLDCSIFKLSKGMCCLLTITTSDEETDEDGVTSIVEYYKTACIIMQKLDAKSIKTATQQIVRAHV